MSDRTDAIDRSTFASLKLPDYLFLWIGMLGAAFALNMQLIAQGWLVYEMTVSKMNLGWVTIAFMFPQVAFALLGGVLADRFNKKRVLLWAQFGNALVSLAMAIIVLTGRVTFFDFIWMGALNGTILALSIPARTAFIPQLVGEPLMFNAMAFNTASWNLARILGPVLAGFIIALVADGDTGSHFGVGVVYLILTGLYLISAVTVFGIRHSGDPEKSAPTHPLTDVREGMTYVWNSPIVGGLILLSIMPFLFGLTINTLLPAYNTDVLGGNASDLGILMSGMGLGAIVGSLVLAKLGELRNKGFWLFLTSLGWGVGVAWFGYSSVTLWALISIAAVGFVSSVNMSMNRSLVQLQVRQSMRGRVMSIDMMSHGLMPLGVIPVTLIAERHGVQMGLIASGALLVVSTLLLWVLLASVRRIDRGYRTQDRDDQAPPLAADPSQPKAVH
ncbi:MAG: MFS transporter [Pseudomonadota bacterium]